jgi:hypothetical protein
MMFLCGLDADDQAIAINLASARSVVLVRYDDGDTLLVEFSDSETSRSVDAQDSVICTTQHVCAVLMSMKERKT